MPHSPLELLQHILEEVDYVSETSKDLSKERFLNDETLKRSFVRSIEIIGEASNKIAPQCLIHDCFSVDYDIVWDVIAHKIPELREQVKEILRGESKEASG